MSLPPEQAITKLAPSLNWSVLLEHIFTTMPSSLYTMSLHCNFASWSQRIKPSKANRHTANSLISVSDGVSPTDSTIDFNIYAFFFGFANNCLKRCIQARACTASSIAALDPVDSLKCVTYSAKWISCTGKPGTPAMLPLLICPRYFLVVPSAWLLRMIAGRPAASQMSKLRVFQVIQ